MRWFVRSNSIDRAIDAGDLDLALQQWREGQEDEATDGSHRRLMVALMGRAESQMSRDNLVGAWSDLTLAAQVAPTQRQDEVSRQTNRLVELTIDSAQTQLLAGRTRHARQLLDILTQRRVLDWRADQIQESIRKMEQAESLAAAGDFDAAIKYLETAFRRQPELTHIPSRIEAQKRSREQVTQLSDRLQKAAIEGRWHDVDPLCGQLLEIAPRHEIALAARRHALQQIRRRTQTGSRRTQVPQRLTDSNSFFQFNGETSAGAADPAPLDSSSTGQSFRNDQFLLWVDGVGGFLICLDPVLLIGQAHASQEVAIGLQGDLRKHHARIELLSGRHLVHPLGPVALDGKDQPGTFVLGEGQTLGLGNGVQLKYHQPHPLSKTARLDFVSRHRTHPWSDGIVLATQAVIVGPDRRNHIVCRDWDGDVIFFRRDNSWYCRSQIPFQVDQGPASTEAPIDFGSQIVGEQFSMTLEPIAISGELR